jgi:hypothetical protein
MNHRNVSLFASALWLSFGCIGPQGAQQCKEPSSGDTASAEGEQTAEAAPATLTEAVVPKGTLIWDGGGISNLAESIEPPGSWFVYSDTTASGVKNPPTVDEFTKAIENGVLHTWGKGYTEWGGGVGTNLVGSPVLTPVDASKFKGIKFKASGSTPMKFLVGSVATMPEFGRCKKCYDHHRIIISDLSKEPKTYEIKWEDLKQTGWGDKAKFDTKLIVALNFTSKDAMSWDFTIDDVAFIE